MGRREQQTQNGPWTHTYAICAKSAVPSETFSTSWCKDKSQTHINMVTGEVGPSPHFLLEARAVACSLLGAQSTPDTDQDPCTLFPPCWQTPSSCKHTPRWLWAPILTLFVFNLLCLLFDLDGRCKILWGLQFWNHQTVSNGSYILPATQLPAADPALLCRGSITWHSHVFPQPYTQTLLPTKCPRTQQPKAALALPWCPPCSASSFLLHPAPSWGKI